MFIDCVDTSVHYLRNRDSWIETYEIHITPEVMVWAHAPTTFDRQKL